MSTLESIDETVLVKIKSIQKILQVYNDKELELYDQADVSRSLDEIRNIENSYNLGTASIMQDYLSITIHDISLESKENSAINNISSGTTFTSSGTTFTSSDKKRKIYNFFIKFLNKENIIGTMNRLFAKCEKLIKRYPAADYALVHCVYEYKNRDILLKTEEKNNMLCVCGADTHNSAKSSEKVCNGCGRIEKLYGTACDEEQNTNTNESNRSKHGRYDPTNHCKYWLECIQAEEKIEIPESVINQVKFLIRQDRQILSEVNCDMYRRYLKDIGCTKYNDHIPLIRKKISGICPPALSENEHKRISIIFSRIVHIFNRIKPNLHTNTKSNCPYHPYFIYKIIDHILPAHDERKHEILACIHLQSRETLIENDLIMEAICAHMPDFPYRPTDSNGQI